MFTRGEQEGLRWLLLFYFRTWILKRKEAGVSGPPLSCFAVVQNHRETGEFIAFFKTLHQVGCGVRSKWHSLFFSCLMCFKMKLLRNKERKLYRLLLSINSRYIAFWVKFSYHCICWHIFASSPSEVFLLFCVKDLLQFVPRLLGIFCL